MIVSGVGWSTLHFGALNVPHALPPCHGNRATLGLDLLELAHLFAAGFEREATVTACPESSKTRVISRPSNPAPPATMIFMGPLQAPPPGERSISFTCYAAARGSNVSALAATGLAA